MTQPALFEDQTEQHPAIALYRAWSFILDQFGGKLVAYGDVGWGLERTSDGNIHFGQLWPSGQSVAAHWEINDNGDFAWNSMHGYYRRTRIQRAVPFLGYSHLHQRYQWLVEFDRDRKTWYGTPSSTLTDYNNRRHYVSEDLLGCRQWRQPRRWCKLDRIDGEWQIRPADVNGEDVRREWERYDRLIERRYNRLERRNLQRQGFTPPPVSAPPPSVRAGGKQLTSEQSVHRLAALLEVHQPARTTPLKRLKEAKHGDHDVDPAYHL